MSTTIEHEPYVAETTPGAGPGEVALFFHHVAGHGQCYVIIHLSSSGQVKGIIQDVSSVNHIKVLAKTYSVIIYLTATFLNPL